MPSPRRNGKYQAKVRYLGGTIVLGTFSTWEEARLQEIEFKISVLEDERKELERAS